MLLEAMLSAAFGGALYGYMQSKEKKNEKIKLEKDKIEQLENIKTWKKCLEILLLWKTIRKLNMDF